MDSLMTVDPNATSMCDGLLLKRDMIRGVRAVQCALTDAGAAERTVAWLPFRRDREQLLPYVLMTNYDLMQLAAEFSFLYAACEKGYVDEIRRAVEEEWDLEAKAMTGTKEKAVKYARFYREVQAIYPALTARLELPPGTTSEREFSQIRDRAAASQAKVQRMIDEMERDRRTWAWVRVSDL
jgi:NADPH-dependent ferric siderophore reductase